MVSVFLKITQNSLIIIIDMTFIKCLPFSQCAQSSKQFISVDSPSWAEQNGTGNFVVAYTLLRWALQYCKNVNRLKPSSHLFCLHHVATGSAYKMIWTLVATWHNAGIEILKFLHCSMRLHGLSVAMQHKQKRCELSFKVVVYYSEVWLSSAQFLP